MELRKLRFFFYIRITLLEAFHAARAVDQLLLARIKGMALVANFDMGAFDRGFCFDDVSARTGKGDRVIFGMYFFFHTCSLVLDPDKNYQLNSGKYTLYHTIRARVQNILGYFKVCIFYFSFVPYFKSFPPTLISHNPKPMEIPPSVMKDIAKAASSGLSSRTTPASIPSAPVTAP
jgi:hypothetical protein